MIRAKLKVDWAAAMSQTVPVPPTQLINGPILIITGPALLEVSALLQLGIKHVKVRDANRAAAPAAIPSRAGETSR
jgi:hypothetical protein